MHQPPDYYKTKQLWAVDEEARKKKMLLYNDRETYYSVRYRMITRGRQYSNKKYLMFRINLVFAREILRNGDNLMSYDKSERIYKPSRSVEQGA